MEKMKVGYFLLFFFISCSFSIGQLGCADTLFHFQAAGFNSVSVYHHWGITEQKAGELNFTEHRSQSDFYQVAKEVGILVMSRPGVSLILFKLSRVIF